MRRAAKLSFIICCCAIVGGAGCGGGGGASPASESTGETRITDDRTSAVIIVPSSVDNASAVKFATDDSVPEFDDMIQSYGPDMVVEASGPIYDALTIEIPRDKITAEDEQIDNVQLFYYDDEDGAWLPFETSYSTSTQLFTGYVMIPEDGGSGSGRLRVRYGIRDMSAFESKCESTGGNFNGSYCECGESTYWKNNTTGCASNENTSRVLNRLGYSSGSSTVYSVMTMNVGNISLLKCPETKLCGIFNEEKIRNIIERGSPSIIMLQEVLPLSKDVWGIFDRPQIDRLIGNRYQYKCTDSTTNVNDGVEVRLKGNSSVKGYGYECIGLRNGIGIEFNDAFIPSDGFGHKIVVTEGSNEGDQDVALIADVTLRGEQKVRLINVHTMTPVGLSLNPFDANAEERAREIDVLLGLYAGKNDGEDQDVLIAGDFNITDDTYPYSQCNDSGDTGGKLARCVLLRYIEQGIYPLTPNGDTLERGNEKENNLYPHVYLNAFTTITYKPLDYVLSTFAQPRPYEAYPVFNESESPCALYGPFYPGMDHKAYYCELDFGTTPAPIGALQIELRWGSSPNDLDSHITGPLDSGGRYHVYYTRAGNTNDVYADYARLDRDDISSYGPETITVLQLPAGSSPIRYSVHNYSDRNSSYSTSLANSVATVKVYDNTSGKLIKKYSVPYEDGTLWTVFEYANGVFNDINYMSYENDPTYVSKKSNFGIPYNDADLIKTLPSKKQ